MGKLSAYGHDKPAAAAHPVLGNPVLYGISFDGVAISGITMEFVKLAHCYHRRGYKIFLDLGYDIKPDKQRFLRPYGDAYSTPWVSTDIVAHEFTHGVTEYAAGLIYANESGAANESFSDIFGTAVEFYVGINPDYVIAEDAVPGGIRYMVDPGIDHYSERVYIGSSYDNGGVHFNSGIQNKAFYLLAEGGTHPQSGVTVTGIGRRAAEFVFYRALDLYVTPSSQFINVRNATVSAAGDLYGVGSAQYIAAQRAWEAVGVGTTSTGGGGSTCDQSGQMQCEINGGTWNPTTCTCRALCSGCEIP